MTFLLLLAALVALLYLGLPIFAGLFLLSLAVLWATEGTVAALGEQVFNQLDGYLLVAIPLFMLMAHVMAAWWTICTRPPSRCSSACAAASASPP
jgi:C4-dicarboxylate transporter DctM subunit